MYAYIDTCTYFESDKFLCFILLIVGFCQGLKLHERDGETECKDKKTYS